MDSRKKNSRWHFLRRMTDPTVPFDTRINMIIAISGTIGNTLGFTANFLLYGMNFPTVFCLVCALILIFTTIFGFSSAKQQFFGWAMIAMLAVFEFPLLVFTYGPVMYPYLMIGFLAMMMLTVKKKLYFLDILLGVYDVAVIIESHLHPYIFGPQESAGLLGSAVATYIISLGALAGIVLTWQNVSVIESSDIDSVSGALTRTGFLRIAEKYLNGDNASHYDILFFDIKNFKVINSVCGLEGGNSFLREVAQKLKDSALKPHLVARMNSDRFLVLAERENRKEETLDELCRISYDNNGKLIPLNMCCGVYPIERTGENGQEACDKAELARRFIRAGQDRHYYIYDENVAQAFIQETELLGELEDAIFENRFEPYYQPIVDCRTGKIVSAEALVRWIHPEKGVLNPREFIPILEKKEMISEVDSIMADKVSSFVIRREKAGEPVVPISLNLSRIDLFDSRLMDRIYKIVTGNAALNTRCRFELTESAYEALPESTMEKLSELRKNGAKILLDDFGTGFSSFGMITDYEFDYIKLDMSFAEKIENSEKVRGVVRSLIEMTHKLGALVIMEGVEKQSQMDFLSDAGCDLVQGFLFHRPLPEKEFAAVLEKQAESGE